MLASDVLDLPSGSTFASRYEIVRMLARGGMGTLFEVVDAKTKRRRALKVMLPEVVADADLRRRFRREATVAASIDTEHIVDVTDAGVDEATGVPYLAMELLEGSELSKLLREGGPLSVAATLEHLGQLAHALGKAHEAGVVHRDLKPENLFVTRRDDGTSRLKILDFGIAKVVRESMSKGPETQGILGTPLYMAPEQIHGEVDVSAQTDIFAFGHIAFALLVGEAYWTPEQRRAESVYALLIKMMKGPPEPASERALTRGGVMLPPAFDAWFAKATAEDPRARFEDVGAAFAALASAVPATEPAAAPSTDGPTEIIPTTPETSAEIRASETFPSAQERSPSQTGRTLAMLGLLFLLILAIGTAFYFQAKNRPRPSRQVPASAR